MLIRKNTRRVHNGHNRYESACDRDICSRRVCGSGVRPRYEKNVISDDFIEAESKSEFDVLCKIMGASEEDIKESSMPYTIVIGRLANDPEKKGTKVIFTIAGTDTMEPRDIAVSGKLAQVCLEYLKKGCLICVEGSELKKGQVSARRVTYLKKGANKAAERMLRKSEKVHKVASICKATANEGDCPVYTVSCITREHAATKKKYSGEFESLQDAMKVCAQAYNAGVDVCVECDGQPYAKIYTKTKEFEDFTEDNSASKAFRDAMMWSQSPARRKAKNEDELADIEEDVPPDIPEEGEDIPVDDSATTPDVNMDIVATESSDEDPRDVRVYAKSHHATVMTESRINGVKMNKMVPGISGRYNGRNRLGK